MGKYHTALLRNCIKPSVQHAKNVTGYTYINIELFSSLIFSLKLVPNSS
jgi:hypothetical protein